MAGWIVVVDDIVSNINLAGQILSRNHMRVSGLRSGAALLEFMKSNSPDLILMDIKMPEMDGYETFKRLRAQEREQGKLPTPVIFLTGEEDDNAEKKSLDLGGADFIRKPFHPDALVKRVENILNHEEHIRNLEEEASTDPLTGLQNKLHINSLIEEALRDKIGAVVIIDLDSFKLVNDLYGHDMGDKLIAYFAELLRSHLRKEDLVGRIGGDEFLAFLPSASDEAAIERLTGSLNVNLLRYAFELLGEDMRIPLGVSVGAFFVRNQGIDFETAFKCADEAVYSAKKNGKHRYEVYHIEEEITTDELADSEEDIDRIIKVLEERNESNYALWLGQDAFGSIYRFMVRYIQSYHGNAYKVLFTVHANGLEKDPEKIDKIVKSFGDLLNRSLRKSDIMMQSRKNQFFLLLPEIADKYINGVTSRILDHWKGTEYGKEYEVTCRTQPLESEDEMGGTRKRDITDPSAVGAEWIVIVDDDPTTRAIAGQIMSEKGYQTTLLSTGEEFLVFIRDNRPDLVLLDIKMPGISGFDTLKSLRDMERTQMLDKLPVIFMTSVEDSEAEINGLRLGAADYVKKPFVPEILLLRVGNILDLRRLQRLLEAQIARKVR